jgi:hypothetical protein
MDPLAFGTKIQGCSASSMVLDPLKDFTNPFISILKSRMVREGKKETFLIFFYLPITIQIAVFIYLFFKLGNQLQFFFPASIHFPSLRALNLGM